MKAYYSLFKMTLIKGLQYRISALAGVSTQFFFGFMFIMVYQAFYLSNPATQPISLRELILIVWLQQAFLVFIMLWFRDSEIINLITTGNIAYELCRPTDIYNFWFAKLIAQRLSRAILRCFPILLIAALLPFPYKFTLPDHLTTIILFFLTLILGLIIIVSISMLIYISMFYTMSPTGSLLMFSVLGEFFAGLTIPIPLMPDFLRNLTYMLPFRYAADLPFRIYAGNIKHDEAIISIGIQLFWILLLLTVGKLWLKKALNRIVIQGG
ncbi:MAG: transporter permease [Haloplasmataceae bacterium]|jgi:ABC-2 type transport system permease protein|nr:transporter permease [Haloplasmataceae bacterium]